MIKNGIDIVDIKRIEHSLKSESFKTRVYGADELKELESKRYESYAGAFCARFRFCTTNTVRLILLFRARLKKSQMKRDLNFHSA